MNNLELVKARLDELGVQYEEVHSRSETTFLLDYNDRCGDYMTSISVLGECVTYSRHYLDPYIAVYLATCKGGTGE